MVASWYSFVDWWVFTDYSIDIAEHLRLFCVVYIYFLGLRPYYFVRVFSQREYWTMAHWYLQKQFEVPKVETVGGPPPSETSVFIV